VCVYIYKYACVYVYVYVYICRYSSICSSYIPSWIWAAMIIYYAFQIVTFNMLLCLIYAFFSLKLKFCLPSKRKILKTPSMSMCSQMPLSVLNKRQKLHWSMLCVTNQCCLCRNLSLMSKHLILVLIELFFA